MEQQQEKDPWSSEPPVETHRGVDLSEREQDKRRYVEQRLQLSLQTAEKLLIETEYDFAIAIDAVSDATQDYIAAESQQARTRVRVIEKLMAESESAVVRKQNEAKRGETLSISAAEKIVSGHPEYTAVRDDVAEKLSYKSACELHAKLVEQTMLNLREIVINRRAGFLIVQSDGRIEAPFAPRAMSLRSDERSTIEQRDSRGLQGIERTVPPRERLVERGVPVASAVHTDSREDKS